MRKISSHIKHEKDKYEKLSLKFEKNQKILKSIYSKYPNALYRYNYAVDLSKSDFNFNLIKDFYFFINSERQFLELGFFYYEKINNIQIEICLANKIKICSLSSSANTHKIVEFYNFELALKKLNLSENLISKIKIKLISSLIKGNINGWDITDSDSKIPEHLKKLITLL